MFHQIFLQNVFLMQLPVILIKTDADQHTPLMPNYLKSALNWLEYTNKNPWGGESPTSTTKSGFALAFKHLIRQIKKKVFYKLNCVFVDFHYIHFRPRE